MQKENQQLANLLELAALLGQQNDFQETTRLICEKMIALFDASVAMVAMRRAEKNTIVRTLVQSRDAVQNKKYHRVAAAIFQWVEREKQSFFTAEVKSDPRLDRQDFRNVRVFGAACVPLRCQATVVGYLNLVSTTPANEIDEHTVPLLEKMAAICAPFLNQSYITQDLLNSPLPESALLRQFAPLGLIGKSAQFVELLRSVETAARSNARVLLEGQSGTGKERIAKAIHHFSSRKNRPFVTIDCGAIPEHLLESELFGHVRGAFTGATQDRIGLIEEARHGTLFLDEMTNLPLNVQAKFLRFLQEGEIRAVGSNLPRKVDIRIIAAASTPLKKLVETGKFREDLFYRLHVLPIYVPTLFERQEDIPHLARHFLKKIAAEQNKPLHDFDSSLMRILQQQKWPGNIRELENFIERLVTLLPSNSTTLTLDSVPHQLKKELKHNLVDDTEQITGSSLHESLYALEEKLIRKALTDHNWNQSRAARALRVSEYTIRYKMEKYGIVKPYKLQSHRSQPD